MSDGGVIKHLSLEGLLKKSGVDFDPYDNTVWENTKNVLKKLEDLQIIKVSGNATITLINWEKRQEHNLTVAERVAKSRAKKKYVTSDVTYVTSEENRIEENRVERESTPSQIAKSFFEGNIEETYNEIKSKLSLNDDILKVEFQKFILYWTEPNKSGTKVRWEQQPTFEVNRRLYTWLTRIKENYQDKNKGRGIA